MDSSIYIQVNVKVSFLNFYWRVVGLQCCVYAMQQNESVGIYISTLFFRVYSHVDHYRVLSRVPVLYSRFLLSILYIIMCICHSQIPS